MLVSHESPLSLLELSTVYNDYDYALVHLFETEPSYREFFEKNIKSRIMYLDNSIFELGKAWDPDKFKDYCNHFCDINENNFYYIVPDSLENKKETISNFENFHFDRGHKICVVQGKTFDEVIECFDYFKGNCEVIGISFDYSFYLNSNGKTNFEKYMYGRIQLMNYLFLTGRLENTKIHLLGCFLPQEFRAYRHIKEIFSIDTSNPVVHGIKGIRYNKYGLSFKETTKLVDLLHYDGKLEDILYNIKEFKKFIV